MEMPLRDSVKPVGFLRDSILVSMTANSSAPSRPPWSFVKKFRPSLGCVLAHYLQGIDFHDGHAVPPGQVYGATDHCAGFLSPALRREPAPITQARERSLVG